MKIGDNAGKEPTGKMINLAGVENGKPIPLMLKVSLLSVAMDSNRDNAHAGMTGRSSRSRERVIPQDPRSARTVVKPIIAPTALQDPSFICLKRKAGIYMRGTTYLGFLQMRGRVALEIIKMRTGRPISVHDSML